MTPPGHHPSGHVKNRHRNRPCPSPCRNRGSNQQRTAISTTCRALNGDLDPKWTEVWTHINLGKIFDITDQRERAVNEYNQAIRTKDNTQGAQEEAAKYLKQPYQKPARKE